MARSVEDRMSFMEHLGELRVRIVRALYALLVGSVPGLYFSQQIVDWLARPVTKLNYSLVFTSPAEALWVQMKVGLIVGLFIAAPGILWQVWAFIAPGLHAHEKKYALPFVLIGSLLFIGGGGVSPFVLGSEEHTSEPQSRLQLVCLLLLLKKKTQRSISSAPPRDA